LLDTTTEITAHVLCRTRFPQFTSEREDRHKWHPTPMRTPARTFRSAIQKLPLEASIAGRWPPPAHYKSHQAHLVGWLEEYDGPGYYKRKVLRVPRSMRYIYAHIHWAPMLLWLAEAAGVRSRNRSEAQGYLPVIFLRNG
jgi:hypothetical protein